MQQLQACGKWPAKPDLVAWMGQKGTGWQNRKTGAFQRAVTLPDDTELLTRHEVQAFPPDLLVTNYSMLEYMLMRPIERPIFDRTREWLAKILTRNFWWCWMKLTSIAVLLALKLDCSCEGFVTVWIFRLIACR